MNCEPFSRCSYRDETCDRTNAPATNNKRTSSPNIPIRNLGLLHAMDHRWRDNKLPLAIRKLALNPMPRDASSGHGSWKFPPTVKREIAIPCAIENSLVVCDESGHTKFPFSFAVLSWGELWLICPELPLISP